MEEVAGDATMDGVAPCRLGTERRQHREIESRKNAAISVQPLWWRRLGRSFIRGNGDDVALPVVQVKMAVEDVVAEPAGPRYQRRILIRYGG